MEKNGEFLQRVYEVIEGSFKENYQEQLLKEYLEKLLKQTVDEFYFENNYSKF